MEQIKFIFLLIVSIAIICCVINSYRQFLCDDDQKIQKLNVKEPFVSDYYRWNWNEPNVIRKINDKTTDNNCSNCSYSMSCDFIDDALPFCYKGYDVPNTDQKSKLFFNNSY